MVDFAKHQRENNLGWYDAPFTAEEIVELKQTIADIKQSMAEMLADIQIDEFFVKQAGLVSNLIMEHAARVEKKFGDGHMLTMQALMQSKGARWFAALVAEAFLKQRKLA